MPRGDRTGPAGMGPMTGRAAGYCAGYDRPGFANPPAGFGRGRGFGRGSGMGRGWRFGYSRVPTQPYRLTREQQTGILEAEKADLEAELKDIQEELKQITTELQKLKKK